MRCPECEKGGEKGIVTDPMTSLRIVETKSKCPLWWRIAHLLWGIMAASAVVLAVVGLFSLADQRQLLHQEKSAIYDEDCDWNTT